MEAVGCKVYVILTGHARWMHSDPQSHTLTRDLAGVGTPCAARVRVGNTL